VSGLRCPVCLQPGCYGNHVCLLCVCARRKFKGAIQMPNVGYGTNKKDRHVLPNGFKKVCSSLFSVLLREGGQT